MRIIQITDLHIGLPEEDTRDVDTKTNFENVLQQTINDKPDWVVISGDVCFKAPYASIYSWLDERITDLPFPVFIIGGNHDDVSMIPDAYLPAGADLNGERYFFKEINDLNTEVFFLDTHTGSMSDTQMNWFRDQLNRSFSKRQVIFMHHPPVIAGVGYMDLNHAFRSRESFSNIMSENGCRVPIFCGHYHVEKTIEGDGMIVHITPSTFFQICHDQDHFCVDHYQVGYRIIDILPDSIMHRVRYLPGARFDS